jgi:hypothetical protein
MAATLAGAAGPVLAARADELSGSLSMQYQQVDQRLRLMNPDSTFRSTTQRREYWLQSYELNYSSQFTDRLHFLTQLRYTDVNFVGRPESERVPFVSMRLIHPEYGVTASFRPATTVGVVSAAGFGAPPGAAAAPQEITSQRRETSLIAYLAPTRLPRLDLAWVRRSLRDDISNRTDVGLDRSARSTYEVGPLSLRAGYGTLARQVGDIGRNETFQRSYDAGTSLRALSRPNATLLLDYQFTGNDRGAGAAGRDRAYTHTASVSGNLRQSRVTNWTLYYGYRRSALRSAEDSDLNDHDGSLLFNYTPRRALNFSAGGGVHTVRPDQREDLLWYATAIAAAQGPVRHGWTGTASLTHVTNWDPTRKSFGIETGRLGSGFILARGLTANLDVQMTANGDSAARGARVVLQPSAGVTASPLRGLYADYSWRVYRAGPTLGRSTSHAVSDRLELRWRPRPTLELTGGLGHTGALPRNQPRAVTRQLTLRWTPSARFQATGSYVKSTQTQSFAAAEQLSGQELVTTRLLAGLSRSLTLNAGYSLTNRHRPTQASQVDAMMTWTFGR